MVVTASSLLSRMGDLELQDSDRTFLGMLYGPSGSGKTTLSVWLAQNLISDTGRILYIDSADGWVSLDNAPSLKQGVIRLPYTSYGDLPAVANAIKKRSKGFENIEVVIIDEIDSVADDTLVTVVREKHGTAAGDRLPEIEGKDYRPMGDLIRQAVSQLHASGVHLILVDHDKKRMDHRKVEITGPSLTPALKKKINELLHVTAYCSAEIKGTNAKPEYVRTVQCLPTGLIEAKTRVGALRASVKMSHEDFVNAISGWVSPDGGMAEDLQAPETDEMQPDELPTDGIPVGDVSEDDEPAYVSSDSNE